MNKEIINDFVNKYSYRINWSEEDQVYIAKCLEFPSLKAHGKTMQKALKEITFVVTECINWMEESNEEIPEPLSTKEYSGKFTVRLPSDIHKLIALNAAEKGVSINKYVLTALQERIK